MSRASSLTPEEKDAAAKQAATLDHTLILNDLQRYAADKSQIEVLEHAQALLQADMDRLNNIEDIQLLNTNAGNVASVKKQVKEIAEYLFAAQAQNASTARVRELFTRLVAADSDNPLMQSLASQVGYYELAGGTLTTVNEVETREDAYIEPATAALGNAMIDLLRESKQADMLLEPKMWVTRDYYKTVISHYLRKTIPEAHKKLMKEELLPAVLDKIVGVLTELLYKPRKDKEASAFASELDRIERKILSSKQRDQLVKLEDVLTANYSNFNDFEKAIVDFRNGQYSRLYASENVLYSLLPDTAAYKKKAAEVREIKEDNIYGGDDVVNKAPEPDYFPLLTDKTDKENFASLYAQYNQDLSRVRLTDAQGEELRAQLYPVMVTSVRSAIQNNCDTGAMDFMVTNLVAINVSKAVIAQVVKVMKEVIAAGREAKSEPTAPKLAALDQENTVLGLCKKLNNYLDTVKDNSSIRKSTVKKLENIQMSQYFQAMAADMDKINQFEKDLKGYPGLRADYQKLIDAKEKLVQVVSDKIDAPVVNLLRAQVLHAAKLYLNPEKTGWMHNIHHLGSTGEANVLNLIQALFSPEVKTLKDAVACIVKFKDSKGLHTNSFDTLLSYVLYNEGYPLGLFHTKLDTALNLNLNKPAEKKGDPKPIHPGYRPEIIMQKTDVKALKGYLKDHYDVPLLSMSSRVGAMVRGSEREEAQQRAVVRTQMKQNLLTMAGFIEDYKQGKNSEAKLEITSSAIPVTRHVTPPSRK